MAATYYIATAGNDSHDGLTPATAWATISKVNAHSFVPGDTILFNGGNTFSGEIDLTVSGTSGSPITFASYGTGVATISKPLNSHGFYAHNCAGVSIHDLNFTGPANASDTGHGIYFNIDSAAGQSYIRINNVNVTGCSNGIYFSGNNAQFGFSDVRITNSNSYANQLNGIYFYGSQSHRCHSNVYVGYCKTYNNIGNAASNPSGFGISLGKVTTGTVEFCSAYGNGANSPAGPAGIWTYDSLSVVIQFCEAYNQVTIGDDGHGFDIDGECDSCIIQYCYSHGNAAGGFCYFQYDTTGYPAQTFQNNIIRYNISENDLFGIFFFGANVTSPIQNSTVYNNTIYTSKYGMFIHDGFSSGITIKNNILFNTGAFPIIYSPNLPGVTFSNNDYYSSGAWQISWVGTTYTTLASWGQDVAGLSLDPKLTNPGNGGTVGDPTILPNLSAYRLQSTSPMINAGLTISSPGAVDFYRAQIPYQTQYDIGAHEFRVGTLSGNYTDPSLIGSPSEYIYFGGVSQWKYPSRAYLETRTAATFLNGVGINFSNELNNIAGTGALLVAQMLSKHGFKRARIEIGWGALDYNTETVIPGSAGMAQVQACQAYGIRPIIILNGNQAVPCPFLSFNHTITTPAAQGATTITLDSVTGIVPGYSGFNLTTYTGNYTMNDPLVVSVAGSVCTLSHPLYTAVPAVSIGMNTFKYRPFAVVGDPQYNATEQAASIAGWQTYARAIATAVGAIMGPIGFDLEIWNEVTFGSQFLTLPSYYNLSASGIPDLVTPVATTATANPVLFSGVAIENGLFSNESPFAASSQQAARIGALGKHPYPLVTSYPAGQQGNTAGSGFLMLNDQYGYEAPVFPFLPTYSEYFPEYYGTALQTETVIRDMSPVTNPVSGVDHGRFTRLGNPCDVFVTEIGTSPLQVGISDVPTALLMKAKGSARTLCFYINKGSAMVDLFAVNDGGGDLGFQVFLQSFLDNIVTPNAPYPVPDTAYLSPAMQTISNIVATMQTGLATITNPRSLGVLSISDTHGHCQFGGDGTLAHPNGYDREAFQVLPFQVNNTRFVVPYYVMTRNIMNPLTPEVFTIGIGGVNGSIANISVYDPLNNVSVPVTILAKDTASITLSLTAADYPYLLILDDTPAPPPIPTGMLFSDLLSANQLADPRALAKPSIAIISARTHWKDIQKTQPVGGVPTNNPNDASFSWGYIDSIFAQAATFNKGVWLRVIIQEGNAPSWLRAIVAQYIDVTGTMFNIWWDTNYIAYLTALIQAIATRYGSNPRFQVLACNFAAAGSGDWSIPHLQQSQSPGITDAANWGLTAGWVCPAYGNTVTALPKPNSTIYPGWVVFVQNFGYFIVQSVFGPTNNPSSVVLLNPGYAGNASSGNTGAGKVMQVSDVQQLQSPKYNYTTAQLTNALNQIITVAVTALPSTVIFSHEVGRDGSLDPFPNSGTTYAYNAATVMAQYGYLNAAPGRWAIAKNGFQNNMSSPAEAYAAQDGNNFYLLAETVFGSTNASGTTGVIPLGGLLNGQCSWPAFDTTGTYSPATTGGQTPYQANDGVPYGAAEVGTVFNGMVAAAQSYGVHILELYEVDIINVLSIAPTNFTITATASTGVGQWSGQQVWTVTAPWGNITRPTFMEAIQQLVWKAGSQYGGRMEGFFATEATNVTEVGTP